VDGTARLWDAATGDELGVLPHDDRIVSFAVYTPDGRRVVTACGETVRVWDAARRQELAVLRGHEKIVRYAAFSPDGTRLVTSGFDSAARVWDSVPYRVRWAEREAEARGEDGSAVVRAWVEGGGG
jgi:WD40 repeat protein